MLPETHGVMVSGVSSCISAAWIRKQVISEYDPGIEAPSLETRLQNRAPLAIAGLGFTGLSAVAAKHFDKRELTILADPEKTVPPHQQLNNHRYLHSIPYVGGAVIAAHLIKDSASEVGKWIAKKLNLSEISESIINNFRDLAEYVINSLGTGIAGHILGDLPTKGALRFLKPLITHDFSLNLFKHSNPEANWYFQVIGWILTGGAWATSSVYIASWEPPEQQILSYIKDIASKESAKEAIQLVWDDISDLFTRLVDRSQKEFWNSPLFKHSDNAGSKAVRSVPVIDQMYFDTETIWGMEDLSEESIKNNGILPAALQVKLDQKSIYSKDIFEMEGRISIRSGEGSDGGVNLLDPTMKSGTSPISSGEDPDTSIWRENSEETIFLDRDDDTSIFE